MKLVLGIISVSIKLYKFQKSVGRGVGYGFGRGIADEFDINVRDDIGKWFKLEFAVVCLSINIPKINLLWRTCHFILWGW